MRSLNVGIRDVEKVLGDMGINPDECLLWAFGAGYGLMLVAQAAEVWNEKHGHIFELYAHDGWVNSLERIGEAYKKVEEEEEWVIKLL